MSEIKILNIDLHMAKMREQKAIMASVRVGKFDQNISDYKEYRTAQREYKNLEKELREYYG